MKSDISLLAMDRIARRVSGMRVAHDAKEAMREAAQHQLEQIIAVAKQCAENAGRRTILVQDVQLALHLQK